MRHKISYIYTILFLLLSCSNIEKDCPIYDMLAEDMSLLRHRIQEDYNRLQECGLGKERFNIEVKYSIDILALSDSILAENPDEIDRFKKYSIRFNELLKELLVASSIESPKLINFKETNTCCSESLGKHYLLSNIWLCMFELSNEVSVKTGGWCAQ